MGTLPLFLGVEDEDCILAATASGSIGCSEALDDVGEVIPCLLRGRTISSAEPGGSVVEALGKAETEFGSRNACQQR